MKEDCANGTSLLLNAIEDQCAAEATTTTTTTTTRTTTILKRGQYGNPKDFFVKSWSEYERGFGDIDQEFWLGLTKMAELTATGRWELEVVLTDYSGQNYTALYSDFSVGDSSTNYRLSLSGYNAARSTLPDTLNDSGYGNDDLDGMAFSTRDR